MNQSWQWGWFRDYHSVLGRRAYQSLLNDIHKAGMILRWCYRAVTERPMFSIFFFLAHCALCLDGCLREHHPYLHSHSWEKGCSTWYMSLICSICVLGISAWCTKWVIRAVAFLSWGTQLVRAAHTTALVSPRGWVSASDKSGLSYTPGEETQTRSSKAFCPQLFSKFKKVYSCCI
jgi:hypothetical protein